MEEQWIAVGKQMPYRVPTAFFEENEARLMRSIARKRLWRATWWIGAAASVALVLTIGLCEKTARLPEGTIYAYNEEMADEDLSSWIEFYEADIFLSATYPTYNE